MIEAERAVDDVLDLLRADAQITAAAAGGVYRDLRVTGSVYPAVIVSSQSATDRNALGGARVWQDCLILVRAIDDRASYGRILPVADRVDALLQGRSGPHDGVQVAKYRRVTAPPIPFEQAADGKVYATLAQVYRTEAYPA